VEGTFIQTQLNSLRSIFTAVFVMVLLTACADSSGFQAGQSTTGQSTPSTGTSSTGSTAAQSTSVFSAGYSPQPLVWDSSGKSSWDTIIYGIVNEHLSVLDTAKDIADFCPAYGSLSKDQKIQVWADLFAADSYYESGWNQASYSVDVGTANNDNSWSVGLLQMSVVDQGNYGLTYGYTFAQLETAGPNLELGITVMSKQIAHYGTVLMDAGTSVYWSTLSPGGKYDHSKDIEGWVQSLTFCK
jgi:hypothetical protein